MVPGDAPAALPETEGGGAKKAQRSNGPSALCLASAEVLSEEAAPDSVVDGVASRSGDIERHERREIGERQFLHGEGVGPVEHEECDCHGGNHRERREAEQEAEDEAGGAHYLGEDDQRQRQMAADAERVGESFGQLAVITQFVQSVAEKQSAEQHPEDENRRVGLTGAGSGGKEKSLKSVHVVVVFVV